MHHSVYGNQSWTVGSPMIFQGDDTSYHGKYLGALDQYRRTLEAYPDSYKQMENWSKAEYFNGNVTVKSINNVYFDGFGRIHYSY